METNKILLFIVEGLSDEQSLAPALERIVLPNNVKFKVVHGDITSNNHTTPRNIERKLVDEVILGFFRDSNSIYTPDDLLGIVQVTDLDGAFIPDSCIDEDTSLIKPSYEEERIVCKNKHAFVQTKNNKKQNISKLITISFLSIQARLIPYSIYYMSCNLDHVLHNMRNATDEQKRINSIIFGDNYDDPVMFEAFFNNSSIRVNGTYQETWDYIKIGKRSLSRCSNFWLCIDKYK